jgi:predicted double-glycine peptidase
VTAHYLLLFDPSLGEVKVSRHVFEKIWNGYLLLIRVRPIPEGIAARNSVPE